MSSGSPMRCSGVDDSMTSRVASSCSTNSSAEVATDPTPMALTRMRGARSRAGQARVVRQRRLGGAVGEVAAAAHPAHHRGDVDDRAAAVLQHEGDRRAGQRVGGGDVEVERLVEVVVGGVHERVGDRAAHVVHHDVEAPEPLAGHLGQVGHAVEIGQVGGDDGGACDPPPRCGRPPRRAGTRCGPRSRRRPPPRPGPPRVAAPMPRPAPVTTADLVVQTESVEDHGAGH